MRKPKPDLGLASALLDVSMRQKSLALRERQIAELFESYCSDIRPWAQRLAGIVSEKGLIGLHPFMVADVYDAPKDKAVAILMSSLIPLKTKGLLQRIEVMRQLFDGSPWDFVQGRYKVTDYLSYYSGIGCTRWQLQQWVHILELLFMSPSDMLLSNLDYYIRTDEFTQSPEFAQSHAEAVFWLSETVLGVEPKSEAVPLTSSVLGFLRAYVPRYKALHDWNKCVDLFHFDYPAKVWYAAQGRDWLYAKHYDDICKMERNLKMKHTRATPMDYYEKWRFRRQFMERLNADLDEMSVT